MHACVDGTLAIYLTIEFVRHGQRRWFTHEHSSSNVFLAHVLQHDAELIAGLGLLDGLMKHFQA